MNELNGKVIPLDKMTHKESEDYLAKINDLFIYCLDAAPFVEMGDTSDGGLTIKLRVLLDGQTIPVGEIIFELQMMLYRRNQRGLKRGEEIPMRLIVSELMLSPLMYTNDFCPRRGLMITMKYVEL